MHELLAWNFKNFKKFHKIQKKIPVSEFLFWWRCRLEVCNFIKNRLQHRCFPVKFAKFSTTPILKNTYRRLLPKNKQLQVLIHSLSKMLYMWSQARHWAITVAISAIKILTKFHHRNYLLLVRDNSSFAIQCNVLSIFDSYHDWNRIRLKVTDVLSSRKLLFHSNETNADNGKYFYVVAVLFTYFGI